MRRRGVTVLLGALLTALLSIGVLRRAHPVRGARPGPDGQHPRHGRRQGGHPGHRPGDLHLRRSAPADHGRGAAARSAAVGDRRLVLRGRGGGAARAGLPAGRVDRSRSSSATPRTSRSRRPAPRPPRCVELGYPVQVVVKTVAADGPAAGALRVGDVVTSVDGQPVTGGRDQVTELIRAKPAGTALTDRLHPRRHARHRDGHQPGAGRPPADRRGDRPAAAAPVHARASTWRTSAARAPA